MFELCKSLGQRPRLRGQEGKHDAYLQPLQSTLENWNAHDPIKHVKGTCTHFARYFDTPLTNEILHHINQVSSGPPSRFVRQAGVCPSLEGDKYSQGRRTPLWKNQVVNPLYQHPTLQVLPGDNRCPETTCGRVSKKPGQEGPGRGKEVTVSPFSSMNLAPRGRATKSVATQNQGFMESVS